MTIKKQKMPLLICLFTLFFANANLSAQSITYQGELNQNGGPANGQFNMVFGLWNSPSGGTLVDSVSVTGVDVSNGRFTTELGFNVESFGDSGRWLEINVAGNTLQPRQAVNHTPYALQTQGIFVDAQQNVGLGTSTASARLTVFSDTVSEGNNTAAFVASSIGPWASHIHFGVNGDWYIRPASEAGRVIIGDNGTNVAIGNVNPLAQLHVRSSDLTEEAIIATSTGNNVATIAAENFGQGYALTAISQSDVTPTGGGAILVGRENQVNIAIDNNEIAGRNDGVVSNLNLNPDGGNVVIGVNSNGTSRLRAPVVEITGGSDFSEMFDVRGDTKVEPGMVVVIDSEKPGSLVPSSQANDRRVAGIISGAGGVATGMTMGQKGTIADGEYPVALTGRVYCLVDATDTAIEPGDMLTTSSTIGHAMKVEDPDSTAGAIIGKAMTALGKGEKGLVLVLVNLQ